MKYALVFAFAIGSLLAQDPNSARDWLNRGVTAFKQAQYPVAVGAFQKAVEADPNWVTGYLYLGTAYMQQFIPGADSPENLAMAANAHAAFQKVLALDANNLVALTSEASVYLNQKQWDMAKQLYTRITTVSPNSADAYYSLGFIAWMQWYPVYGKARAQSGLKMEDPGPIPNPAVRASLKAQFDPLLDDGENALTKALAIRPAYSDAMAYMNLLVRERADLLDSKEAWQSQIAVADDWVRKALDAKKAQAEKQAQTAQDPMLMAAAAPPPPPPPPPPPRGGGGGDRSSVPAVVAWDPAATPTLLTKVDPIYPPRAIEARISGMVVLNAVIGTDGRLKNLSVASGHPLLVGAALNAVKDWVYAPTVVGGQAVEVKTTIQVPFTLPK